MQPCVYCGREFLHIRENQKFCSQKCYNANQFALHPGQSTEYRRRKRIVLNKKCRECEVEYSTTNPLKHFCSPGCKVKWHNAARETTQFQIRECPVCHKTFRPMQKTGVGRTYCTPTCRNQYFNSTRKAANKSKGWKGRVSGKWGGNWYKALVRDKFSCTICGFRRLPSDATRKPRYDLEVHHRDGTGERSETNNGLDNLRTLCVPCHSMFHSNICLVEIDGEFIIRGKIFGLLGLTEVKTA